MSLKHLIILVVGFNASGLVLAAPPVNVTVPLITDRPSSTRPEAPKFKSKKPQPGLTVPAAPVEKSASDDTSPMVFAKGFRFNGHTVFSDGELEVIAAPYTGRAVSLSELEQLRYLLTQHYVDHGYLNSGAVLPSQSFSDGMIDFKIIEGTLNDIRITGTGHLNSNYVERPLDARRGTSIAYRGIARAFPVIIARFVN